MEEFKVAFKKCEICESEATTVCFKCFSYFCDVCSKFIHEKKINSSHTLEKIDYFLPIDLKCQKHPKNILNLFCIEEKGNLFLYLFF